MSETPEEARTHRLVSRPTGAGSHLVSSACGTDKPGDTLAANSFPLTCPKCRELEGAPTPLQLRTAANGPWEDK